MKRNTDRILTTHVGSLPRPDQLRLMLIAKDEGEPYDRDAFEAEPEKYLAGSQLVGQRIAASDRSSEHSHKGQGCCG